MTTAPKFVPDNNTPAAAPPEVPQWSEPMRYDVPQSNGCAGCPRLFVGTKWVGEICGAVYLGHNSVKYAERIVALWNDDIARHAPQPEAQPATETADEREANLSTEQVEQMLAESWKIIKNAEGNALTPAQPQPVRYACTKLAAVGDTVKVLGSNPPLHMKVEEISPAGGLYIKSLTGTSCMLLSASQVEFVPEVTPAHPVCRGCNQPLKAENAWMSDGCPCNNPRGINHGLVPKEVCTCEECAKPDHIVDANKMIEPATDFDFDEAANKAAAVIKGRLDSDTLTVSADMLSESISAQIRPGVQELYKKLQHRRCDLHADLNKRVAEAIGNPFTGPGSSWHDLPEKVANLKSEYEYQRDAVMRGIEHCKSFSERLTAATTRAEAAEAKCAEYRDTFTAANEMRLSGVRLRQAVQQRAELAEMRCTEALDRLEVANQQLAELLAANERMRAAMNDIDAYVRDIRHGATFADSMRDTIIITIRQALAAAETGVAK